MFQQPLIVFIWLVCV